MNTKNLENINMRVTVKEGWSEKSKMAVFAIIGSLVAIIAVVILD
ncbi:MAG: hypothetical protein ACE5RJ_04360 [Nitrosopumilaceae archaeon]